MYWSSEEVVPFVGHTSSHGVDKVLWLELGPRVIIHIRSRRALLLGTPTGDTECAVESDSRGGGDWGHWGTGSRAGPCCQLFSIF